MRSIHEINKDINFLENQISALKQELIESEKEVQNISDDLNISLKNCTVKELIELLKQCDPKAIICSLDVNWRDNVDYSTFEGLRQVEHTGYYDDRGYTKAGKIVVLY